MMIDTHNPCNLSRSLTLAPRNRSVKLLQTRGRSPSICYTMKKNIFTAQS